MCLADAVKGKYAFSEVYLQQQLEHSCRILLDIPLYQPSLHKTVNRLTVKLQVSE